MEVWCMSTHYNPRIVTNGLFACWDAKNNKSYPGSGSTWYDISGKGNHLTLYNSPTYDSGTITFNGISQYAKIANIDLSGTNAVTVQYIMKADSYPSSGLPYAIHELSDNEDNVTTGFVATFNDYAGGTLNWQIGAVIKGNVGYNYSVYDKTILNQLNWVSICIIHDKSLTSNENSIYVNSIVATPIGGAVSDNTNNFGNLPFYLATRGGTTYFAPMKISCCIMYNRVLSAEEVRQNFNALRGRFGI
jgi:hypothetical protein